MLERRSASLAPPPAPVAGAPRRRPVILATTGVPVAPQGERVAIESARGRGDAAVARRHATPARALLEVVREQEAGLLVLAPDPAAIGARTLRRLARRVCATAGCLVWVAPDGPVDSRRALL